MDIFSLQMADNIPHYMFVEVIMEILYDRNH